MMMMIGYIVSYQLTLIFISVGVYPEQRSVSSRIAWLYAIVNAAR